MEIADNTGNKCRELPAEFPETVFQLNSYTLLFNFCNYSVFFRCCHAHIVVLCTLCLHVAQGHTCNL